ncbi:MAG: L,D-transpeptidase family protein [Lachnospiraceae bacterium]|nr:L,D-transpeptidase family protein [Lachnospiraceae bacterium]
MKKRLKRILFIFCITPIIMFGLIYIGLTAYYADGFMFGVFINGIYATGKTPEEINEKLLEQEKSEPLIIVDKFDESISFDLKQIGYQVTYLTGLKEIHKKQNPFLWFKGLSGEYSNYSIEPEGIFDEEKLKNKLFETSFIKNAGDKNKIKVEIEKTSEGYQLVDTTKNLLNKERALEAVSEVLKKGEGRINLKEKECYDEVELTKEMKDNMALWEKIERFQSGKITYQMEGEQQEILDASVTSNWILQDEEGEFLLDEKGELQLDQEKLQEFVEGLCDKYDTTKKDRQFQTTRGDVVVVPAGTYGNKIDKKAEIEYLMEAFAQKKEEVHTPAYSQRAWGEGEDDIGDTYIEVDMTEQKLYYYVQGRQVLSASVVTGCTGKGNGTPAKACYIYYKQRNRVLRGEDYETPVDYWMAVYGNIGIHDAKWRGKFGGTIYKSNGSHGCINTPYKEVQKLYEMAEEGTPVMIFY